MKKTLRRHGPVMLILTFLIAGGLLTSALPASAISGTHPVLVVLCNFSDETQEPNPPSYYEDMFSDAGSGKLGALDYWHDVSYGNLSVSGTVVKGWYTLSITRDDWVASTRIQKWANCAQAARSDVDFTKFDGIVVVTPNAYGSLASAISSSATSLSLQSLSGAAGNFPTPPFKAYLSGGASETVKVTAVSGSTFTIERGQDGSTASAFAAGSTIAVGNELFGFPPGSHFGTTLGGMVMSHDHHLSLALHEEGHLFGFYAPLGTGNHSRTIANWPAREYCDLYDLGSADCVFKFEDAGEQFGGANGSFGKGPGLNAIQLDAQGWLPSTRETSFDNSGCGQQTYTMAALNHPEKSGFQEIRIPASGTFPVGDGTNTIATDYYTLELRSKTGWDRGIPADAFVLHLKSTDGHSYLVDEDRDQFPVGSNGEPGALRPDSSSSAAWEYIDPGAKTYIAVNSIDSANYTGVITLGACGLDASVDYVGDTSGEYTDGVTLAANLTVKGSSTPIPNATVNFKLGSQTCSDETDLAGHAECKITLDQVPGGYTVEASYAGDLAYHSTSDSEDFTLEKEQTALTYGGATTKDYHDPFTASGTLLDDEGDAVAGRTVAFTLGASDGCTATTNGSGVGSCSVTPSQAAGTYSVVSAFAGDNYYLPSSDSDSFEITHEESTTTYAGPPVVHAGSGATATLKAQFAEDGASDDDGDGGPFTAFPFGQTIVLSLGGQSCTGTTNASGVAQCPVGVPASSSLGPQTVTARFAGDAYYEPSGDSKSVIVFAFPSRGAFVLGDRTVNAATASTTMNWWSDTWWNLNRLTGGVAPDSFKGFAGTITTLPVTSPADVCGTTIKTLPGNSPPPTTGVPTYMGVLVASSVTKSGTTINGRWAKIVVVRTNAGYAPTPGHPGTGTIVGTFCQ